MRTRIERFIRTLLSGWAYRAVFPVRAAMTAQRVLGGEEQPPPAEVQADAFQRHRADEQDVGGGHQPSVGGLTRRDDVARNDG
jgi:hypothetical protein